LHFLRFFAVFVDAKPTLAGWLGTDKADARVFREFEKIPRGVRALVSEEARFHNGDYNASDDSNDNSRM
jgi:hypothetical protein